MSVIKSTGDTTPTVLIVDDCQDLVDLLALFLSRHGINVLSAYSGQQCLEIVRQHSIDVLMLDVMMPDLDGLEVCAALRQNPLTRSVPIVLLTARDDVKTRLGGLQLGVSEFLVKPVSGSELLERIQTQVAISRAIRDIDQALLQLETHDAAAVEQRA